MIINYSRMDSNKLLTFTNIIISNQHTYNYSSPTWIDIYFLHLINVSPVYLWNSISMWSNHRLQKSHAPPAKEKKWMANVLPNPMLPTLCLITADSISPGPEPWHHSTVPLPTFGLLRIDKNSFSISGWIYCRAGFKWVEDGYWDRFYWG